MGVQGYEKQKKEDLNMAKDFFFSEHDIRMMLLERYRVASSVHVNMALKPGLLITSITFDGDHKSGEMMITVRDTTKFPEKNDRLFKVTISEVTETPL